MTGIISSVFFIMAASGIFMDRLELKIPGHINSIVPADLDGDGNNEILVFWRQGIFPKQKHRVSVYSGAERVEKKQAYQVLSLPRYTAGIDVGDVDGDGRADVLLLCASGVEYLKGQKGGVLEKTPRSLLRVMTLAALPGGDFIPRIKLLVDMGQGKIGIVLPTVPIGMLSLYEPHGSEWRLNAMMRVPTRESLYSSVEDSKSSRDFSSLFRIALPRFDIMDFDGDSRKDIIFFSKDSISVFLQRKGGKFPNVPDLVRSFGLITLKERRHGGTRVRGCAADFNGDGHADIMFNKATGGIANAENHVFLFFSRAGCVLPQKPDMVISSDGYGAFVKAVDVDGDGITDLVRPYVKMGIMAMGQVLMTGKLDVKFYVHLCRKGLPSQNPQIILNSSYSVNFRSNQELKGIYPIFGADFTGDGRPDVLLSQAGGGSGKTPDVIQLFAGDEKGFSQEPVWSMELRATTHAQIYSPGANSLPGIILVFDDDETSDVLVVTNKNST